MKARILKPEEEALWGKFIKKHPLATVHQTPAWGSFQAKVSSRGKYWIVVLEKDGEIIGGTLIIRQGLPKGFSWLYAARGPLLDFDSDDIDIQIDKLLDTLKNIAKKEKSIFLRIDPPIPAEQTLKIPHFKPTSHGFQPEHTLILDLEADEDKILAQMKPKGRYNIRLATKKGVQIRKTESKKQAKFHDDIQKFYEILEETTIRDGFSGHKLDFYKNMVETLAEKDLATLYIAEYNGQVIAGIIATFFGDTATYYYGVSSNHHRNVMAPYLLQWTAIQEAKERGHKHYDFLGIAGSNDPKDPWHGITQFKHKFGGQDQAYTPAQEYAFKPLLHFLYQIYKKLRK